MVSPVSQISSSDWPAEAARAPSTILRSDAFPQITPEARIYALKELARRAGVSRDFFEKWVIQITGDHTIVSFGTYPGCKIQFQHRLEGLFYKILQGTIPVARARWFAASDDGVSGPDLILPFCYSETDSPAPLFRVTSDSTLTCCFDLSLSILLTLSRTEEVLCPLRDEHDRFPASASLASLHGFLDRPVLDELGSAFQQVLSRLLPSWRPRPRVLRYKLTHDIDDVGIPFSLHTAIGHGLKRRRPVAAARDLLTPFTSVAPADLAMVRTLAAISTSRGLHSAFYWKASPRGPHDSGYDPRHRKVQRVIDFLRNRGFELGFHPGYETFGNRCKLAAELECARRALRATSLGGRQHYLRWSPSTWLDWEVCGLSYDSTLGFADRFGFRAGTAFPYSPWSFKDNREINLIEIPLTLMDCTPVKYMKLNRTEGLQQIKTLVRRVADVGGVFSLLWHNTPLLDPDYDDWYENVLDLLEGAKSFELPADSRELW